METILDHEEAQEPIMEVTPVADPANFKPVVHNGVCEFCGVGVDCIHYPELNAKTA